MRENRKNIAAGAAFVALIVGFLILISAITTTSDSQETQLVYDAVKNAARFRARIRGACTLPRKGRPRRRVPMA